MNKQHRFSLRKTSLGLCPVVLGLVLLATSQTVVSADEATAPTTPSTALAAPMASSPTETVIPSPVSYVADETKEVGTREVTAQGQDGKLLTDTTAGKDTVTRQEPTETTVIVGTKPTVETKTTKATTEYRLDESKDLGDDQVVTEAKDGVESTTTTYRIAPDYSKTVNPNVLNDNFLSDVDKVTYTVDKSKDLPSDQIVVESLAIPEDQTERDRFRTEIAGKILEVTSAAFLKDPKLIPIDRTTSADDVDRYFSSKYISDALYAQIKAYYETLQNLKPYFEGNDNDFVTNADISFETLTQRYNNSKGVYKVNIEYRNSSISDRDKAWFEAQIDKLPPALKQNLLKLVVTDDKIPVSAKTDSAVGISFYRAREIWMNFVNQEARKVLVRNPETGVEEEVEKVFNTADAVNPADNSYGLHRDNIRLLLHELSHNLDHDSGLAMGGLTAYVPDSFSSSPEFLQVYEQHYKGNPLLNSYYADNPEEAFAEGFAQYMRQKIYSIPYMHYFIKDGTRRVAWENEEHYNDLDASNPFEDTKAYYAKLYTQLFEQPQDVKVDVATIKTTSSTAQNGLVIYGAKSTEQTVRTAYNVRYQGDDSKEVGQVSEVGGKDGVKLIRTSYVLKDNKPQAVESVLSEVAAVDKVITKGTKATTAITDIVPVTVKYIQDALLEKGQERADEEQTGSQGYTTVTTTYTVDALTGELLASEARVVTPMVEKVIYIGTKEASTTDPTQPTTPEKTAEPTNPPTPVQPVSPSDKPLQPAPPVSENPISPAISDKKVGLVEHQETMKGVQQSGDTASARSSTELVQARALETVAQTTEHRLPETGDSSQKLSVLVTMGSLSLLGLAGVVGRKRRA